MDINYHGHEILPPVKDIDIHFKLREGHQEITMQWEESEFKEKKNTIKDIHYMHKTKICTPHYKKEKLTKKSICMGFILIQFETEPFIVLTKVGNKSL